MAKLEYNDMSSDSNSGDDWEENSEDHILCLFCTEIVNGFPSALHHIETLHKFDLCDFIRKHIHDTYSYIKLINFVRHKEILPEQLSTLGIEIWDKDEYLHPVVEDDPWLMYDIEDLINIKDVGEEKEGRQMYESNNVILSQTEYEDMKRTIRLLKSQLKESETTCFLVKQQMEEMKEKAQKLILGDDLDEKEKNPHNSNADEGYFNTYSHFAIHHEMLTDKVRTESYRDALLTNSNKFHYCVMLDVGCGTGILSMFAAKSGCRKVISVDQSDMIYQAMDIVRENNLNDIITLKKGRLEDINIGLEKVDAIISEWMGYFLLFEGMLDTVIYARDRYLTPGGVILPNRCTISIVGSGDTKRYLELVDYWSNVYGFKMSCMKKQVLREPSIEICNVDDLITSTAEIQAFDLYKVTKGCVNFTSPFTLNVKKTGSLTAIIGYFDIFFDLENPVHFSTGPHSTSTHWKQTVFSLSEPISITEGEVINGMLKCQRHDKDDRGLMVVIHIKNFCQTYFLD
ncbi:protein arginine N-methyltransferase 1 isoform X2 [Monomorium pharaonis]|uniref:protein arginine N-methyltransferase 1 isoform X2 n=1 Tax=Monomorium pharaonis TaxID=307658 RepID=UPI00063F0E02|nr:protein arginine N-methyltransferase 1 isoform X2 [Monomorium pharaonis]